MTQPFQRTRLYAGILFAVSSTLFSSNALANSDEYLVVWSGDQVTDQPGRAPDADFIAIIDTDKKSETYGKVVNTAVMASIPGEHLLAETENFVDNALNAVTGTFPSSNGDILAPNLSSAVLNEAHHFNADHVIDPITEHHYVYPGGLISANVFGCDITDPLNIKPVPGTLIAPGVRYNPQLHAHTINNLCGLAVSSRAVTAFSGTDDMFVLPNGNIIATYMGAKGSAFDPTNVSNVDAIPTVASTLPPTLTTPGGLVEFKLDGTVVGQYSAVPAQSVPGHGYFDNGNPMLGPKRYAPRTQIAMGGVDGNGNLVDQLTGLGPDTGHPDTGLLAHPHGIDFRADLTGRKIKDGQEKPVNGILMTSDYADPVSVALSGNMGMGHNRSLQSSGTTVRLWDMSNLAEGPYAISQMPDGPRVELAPVHEEPEGLMAMAMTKHHKGAFVASMSGGALFYSADVTVSQPEFKLVYDFGPSTGASVFRVTQDDNYLVLPLAGIQSKTFPTENNPVANRDYDDEHTPRVLTLDISNLLSAGTNFSCDAASASTLENTGDLNRDGLPDTFSTVTGLPVTVGAAGSQFHPNNNANDCPKVVSVVKMGSAEGHLDNATTRGGPHFVVENDGNDKVATSQYFVDLREFAIPGIGALVNAFGLPNANDPFYGSFPNGVQNISSNALPGSGSIGDDTVCLLQRNGGLLSRIGSFDRLHPGSPNGCIDMDYGDSGLQWPTNGSRAVDAGNATPHAMTFVNMAELRNGYPVAIADAVSTPVNTDLTISVLANDSGQGLVLKEVNSWTAKGGRASIVNGAVLYKPQQGYTGVDSFWYAFQDSQGRANSAKVTVTVTAAASPYPVALTDSSTTAKNVNLTIDVLSNDTGVGLQLQNVNDWTESGGRASIVNNKILYKPKLDYTGEDGFWYSFVDSQGRSNSAKVTVNVTASSSPYPVGYADKVNAETGVPLTIDVLANDTGNGLTISNVNAWSLRGGQVSVINNKLSYTSASNFKGVDKIWYVFKDSAGRSNSSEVTITVD